jgi:hypothetical protein
MTRNDKCTLTIEKLREFEGFANLSEDTLHLALETLHSLVSIAYTQKKKK